MEIMRSTHNGFGNEVLNALGVSGSLVQSGNLHPCCELPRCLVHGPFCVGRLAGVRIRERVGRAWMTGLGFGMVPREILTACNIAL